MSNQKGKRTPGGDKFPKNNPDKGNKKNEPNQKFDFDDPGFWDKIEKELDFELRGDSEKESGNSRGAKLDKEHDRSRPRISKNTEHRSSKDWGKKAEGEWRKPPKKDYNQDSEKGSFSRKRDNFSNQDSESDRNTYSKIREAQSFEPGRVKKEFRNKPQGKDFDRPSRYRDSKDYNRHPDKRNFSPKENSAKGNSYQELIRLNRFIANAGVCSRRKADELIRNGEIQVNGQVITELGYKVKKADVVIYKGKRLVPEKKVYILLNKPKDTLTTAKDPEGRRTVFDLIAGATSERVYPVGRLDRNTTGLLFLTNDGELADRLMHPSSEVEKVYHVVLDRNFEKSDFEKLAAGIELEDGFIAPDSLSYTNNSFKELGVEIHSGRNRIVRRMFEHLGYKVVKLDRVLYAGLTKKGLERGAWRFLTPNEVRYLYSKASQQKSEHNSQTSIEE